MANISYVRAGASCLPLIGPIVGICNISNVDNECTSEGIRLNLNTQTPQNVYKLVFSQKVRLYAIYGIVGSVLSVATMVGGIALGILNGMWVLTAAIHTIYAALFSYIAYENNKIIQRCLST